MRLTLNISPQGWQIWTGRPQDWVIWAAIKIGLYEWAAISLGRHENSVAIHRLVPWFFQENIGTAGKSLYKESDDNELPIKAGKSMEANQQEQLINVYSPVLTLIR